MLMTSPEILSPTSAPRRVFMVLSPNSLGYASRSLESLFRNCAEQIHLHLITDSPADKSMLIEELTLRQKTRDHEWSVYSEEDLADREATMFGPYPNLRRFRHGHPCWRKITDPLLLSKGTEEMVLLDPDLYFPNSFRFEPTPETGVLLMWQKPCCLVPSSIVRTGMEQGISFAHHVDIGVGGWRGPIDLAWLDWLIGALDANSVPGVMHIEAIVWSALAMRIGGGYLDPQLWHCWHRNQTKRILRRIGVPGVQLLRVEDFSAIKCFHAGGEAKWWLAEAYQKGMMDKQTDQTTNGAILPFEELTPGTYYREQRVKSLLTRIRYYAILNQ